VARMVHAGLATWLCFVTLIGAGFLSASAEPDQPLSPATPPAKTDKLALRVLIETDRGKLTLELLPDVAPKTVARFMELVRKGFYNGLTFYRVAPRFLIEGGDPNGDGTGGSGRTILAEFNEKKHVTGTVGMAHTRDNPDSADSQFYICLEPQPFLDGKYTVFGQVVDGLDVLPKIQEGDVMRKVTLR